MLTLIISLIAIVAVTLLVLNRQELLKVIDSKDEDLANKNTLVGELSTDVINLRSTLTEVEQTNKILGEEIEKLKKISATILSQKKSSETRLGQISENLVPFLDGFAYDPKTCHFLGNPIDYVVFDTNSHDPAVVFLEIKTGNSKLSPGQKQIKNLIKTGKVRFEEIRLNEKGLKFKEHKNE